MIDKVVKLVTGQKANPTLVASHLADLAKEWADKPLGTGVIVVIVRDEDTPTIYGFGDCGIPLIELEMARVKLMDRLMCKDAPY